MSQLTLLPPPTDTQAARHRARSHGLRLAITAAMDGLAEIQRVEGVTFTARQTSQLLSLAIQAYRIGIETGADMEMISRDQ